MADHRHRRLRGGVAFIVLAALVLPAACSGKRATNAADSLKPAAALANVVPGKLLAVRLSKGQAAPAPAKTALIVGAPLDAPGVKAVTDRLSPWTDDGSTAVGFNWPTASLAVPPAGRTVDQPFPAEPTTMSAPPHTSGPLKVLRTQPEGDVVVAPFASITFNQDMIPLGTVDQVARLAVPAMITPAVRGRWQWLGTRTLRFDADPDTIDGLPKATDYRVEVPAGTVSASGAVLETTTSFGFRTPTATVRSFQPNVEPAIGLEPVLVAEFDQRIDPAQVLATIVLRTDKDPSPRPLRLATATEIAADKHVRVGSLIEGRWLAFRPIGSLPTGAAITVEIGPDTPSAEGPRRASSIDKRSLHTYDALNVVRSGCGGAPCVPGSGFQIEFNNALDGLVFDESTITIEPALAGRVVAVYGNVLSIRGATVGRTRYEVTLPSGLTDQFGQQLGEARTLSIEIGNARPMLHPFSLPMTTLDPMAGSPTFTIATVNHHDVRVRTFRVEPKDWPTYVTFLFAPRHKTEVDYQGAPAVPPPPWPAFSDQVMTINDDEDRLVETPYSLRDALGGDDLGHVVVLVEPTNLDSLSVEQYFSNRPTLTWVQATHLGVDAFSDDDELRLWTTDLRTGTPIAGVAVGQLDGVPEATTAEDGWARLSVADRLLWAVTARKGDDTALLINEIYGGAGWGRKKSSADLRWYVLDDRQTYRPGETVSIKGWTRRFDTSGDAQLHLDGPGTVRYRVYDPRRIEIGAGTVAADAFGGFDLSFVVPAGANQGSAFVELMWSDGGEPFQHMFSIQEFRRPEFEVKARSESVGPYLSSRPATVAVAASYFAGGPLGTAPVTWQVSTSATSYRPPGWDQFSFGEWTPPWSFNEGVGFATSRYGRYSGEPAKVEEFSGETDAAGQHFLKIDFEKVDGALPDLPMSVVARANVTDVNRQAWGSSTSLVVHPGQFYVGLAGTMFVKAGAPLDIQAIVTDIDGNVVAGRALQVQASRLEWKQKNGTWAETPVDTRTCDIISAAKAVACSFTTTVGGTYRVSATVADDQGGRSRSNLTRWVSGGNAKPSRNLERQELTVVPAKAEYAPGETAEILLQTPFEQGTGVVTISRVGIVATQQFKVVNGAALVKVPIAERDVPTVNLMFEVVGTAPRTGDDGTIVAGAPPRPAFATGQVSLRISVASRTLTIDATPRSARLEPGASTQLDISVADFAGKPVVGAEFAVVVVDEAVLALSNYKLQDPLGLFYRPVTAFTEQRLGRESIVLTQPDGAGPQRSAATSSTTVAATFGAQNALAGAAGSVPEPSSGGGIADGRLAGLRESQDRGQVGDPPIDTRTNFDALALFKPSTVTDLAGRAVIDVTLPDNLTRYRVMVVAVSGEDRFGSTEANLTARLPLMVRPSAPRFANYGDSFLLPVVLQNQTDAAMTVDVVLQTANLKLVGDAGRRLVVPANNRVEVRFAVATSRAGMAKLRVAAVSGAAADAASVQLPVYTPATSEAFATYGVIDDNTVVSQPVLAPTAVIPEFGGLEITTSSTALQGLTEAVLYLVGYDYDNAIGHASRILTIASLRGVLGAFDAPGFPSPAQLDATMAADIAGLTELQTEDGGFRYWQSSQSSDPFVSVQAVHALVTARSAGISVAPAMLDRALIYLANIEQQIHTNIEPIRDTISAYALNVRALAGSKDPAKAQELWNRRGSDLSLEAAAWLWPIVANPEIESAIERRIENSVVETAGAANFTTSYGENAYLIMHSDRRVDAVVLDALIGQRPNSTLIPKVVAGLLAHRTAGRWNGAEENAFVLLTLKKYFDTYEAQAPSFVANLWLGTRFAGTDTFDGRSADRVKLAIPTAELVAGGNTALVIAKQGSGRLYYRLGIKYAPSNLKVAALDRGFTVLRSYEAVDDPGDVTKDPTGVWHIKAGAKVRVRLTMVAESQRTHVALLDPLPGGFEILNPDLANSVSAKADKTNAPPTQWAWTWFDHQNQRDDRAEAFASYLPGGVYDYSYVARATTPGTFVTPPSRAEQIYEPETFGRSGSLTVIVEG